MTEQALEDIKSRYQRVLIRLGRAFLTRQTADRELREAEEEARQLHQQFHEAKEKLDYSETLDKQLIFVNERLQNHFK